MNSNLSNIISRLEKNAFTFAKYLNYVAGGIIAMMMFLSAADVILRYLFHRPLIGTMALLEVMMASFTALSFSYVESKKGHLTLDFLTSRLPQKINSSLETTVDILNLSMLIILSLTIFKFALYMKTTGSLLGDLTVPTYPFVFIVACGWIYFTIVKIINLIVSIKKKGSSFWIGALFGLVILILLLVIWKSGIRFNAYKLGLVSIVLLIIIALGGMNLGLAMIMISFFGILYIRGLPFSLNIVGYHPYSTASTYNFSVYPLFTYMGVIVSVSGIGEDIFKAVNKWLGHIPGGLAMATVTASAFFAAISGSGTSNAATMGKVALPEMKKFNYHSRLSAGAIAAGGTLGPLIPPSTIFILYGILTQQPIGKLFMAGILPGVMKLFIYYIVIMFICKRHPSWGPPVPEKAPLKERVFSLKYIWSVAILFSLVMGGLYTGAFTPSEAAGIGAFGALICAIVKGGFSFKKLFVSSIETTEIYGSTIVILIGAIIFGTFLSVTRLPFQLADYVASLVINRYIIMSILIILFLILGSIMDILSVVVVVVPIIFPVITALGFDPIWFGVLVCWLFEIGALTPPVGINVFVLKNVAPEIELFDIFAGVAPFYIADIFAIILLVALPQIATFLPDLLW